MLKMLYKTYTLVESETVCVDTTVYCEIFQYVAD